MASSFPAPNSEELILSVSIRAPLIFRGGVWSRCVRRGVLAALGRVRQPWPRERLVRRLFIIEGVGVVGGGGRVVAG